MVFVIVWEFRAREGRELEFERAYGVDGPWARLFAQADGFRGTALFRDSGDVGRYVTIDRWASQSEFETFVDRFAIEYEQIDRDCEALTVDERLVGRFLDTDPGA